MPYPPHVDLSQPCWPSPGPLSATGYGLVTLKGVQHLRHRVAYALHVGDPGNQFVLHACDNPACWNPAHLFEGVHQDNVDDMVSKGRQPRGESHGAAALTEERVRVIRADPPGMGAQRAREYGVSRNVINAARNRKTWKHVV